MKTNYDVVVIGAGSGGLTTAVGLAKVGKSVLLVERDTIGGECTNSGCIPSKALLHHAKTYYNTVKISGVNGNTENFRREAFSYVRAKIDETLTHETPAHFEKLGITVVSGEAIFTGKKTLSISGQTYQFKKAIIATGSSPRLIDIQGLDTTKILTNQNLFTLEAIPARTLIVGAGPIGMEMGQALAMLGSNVTILDNGQIFAKLEDPAIQPIIKQACLDLGITILQQATIEHVEDGTAFVTEAGNSRPHAIAFDKVLIAIGRVPNIPSGLDTAGIRYDTAGITVNSYSRTSNHRVYALGDVANSLKFTHVADDVARGVVTHIATQSLVRQKSKAVPKVTYTEPELAQVGQSYIEAVRMYGENNIHRIEVPFSQNDRARTDNAENGVIVVIVKRLTGKILGAHIACNRAGELIALFTIAIDNNLSLWKLRRTIYAYPTYALIVKKAGDIFFAKQISTLKKDLSQKIISLLPKVVLATAWTIGLFTLYRYMDTNNVSVETFVFQLFDFITQTAWGPLLFILAYTIRPVTFLPGTILTILSGVFFGLWGGIVYTTIGANLSAALAYFIGRYFGGKTTTESVGVFGRFAAACRAKPFISILTMRLLFLPYDAVNYGSGFLKIPFWPYINATIIGSTLGIATFVAVGASISIEEFKSEGFTTDALNGSFLLLSALIFITSLAVAKLLQKK
jgi:pyruvate/2-oxoglutarate dehydrogenase complex dihydrolipoamide dehydrogenase (E3) component/uncharacterized membrane protein YdjX (TVP38/TMEM64 family)